jgi:predicted Fe-Mo cluster-binding NifX family protein
VKVAIASDDGKTIAHHFGMALGFVVFEIRDRKAINKERRKNIGKNSGECGSCDHTAMIRNVRDCKFVISYGMGNRIYNDLKANGITPVVTDEKTVEEALNKFLKNELKNRTDKLH